MFSTHWGNHLSKTSLSWITPGALVRIDEMRTGSNVIAGPQGPDCRRLDDPIAATYTVLDVHRCNIAA